MTPFTARGPRLPTTPRLWLPVAGLLAALALPACGGGDSDPRQADREGIEALVEQINTAVAERDAAAWCRAFSPESVTETFGSPARCQRETASVIEASGETRRLRLEGIAFDGVDRARVSFRGGGDEANLTRVDGQWYLDLLQEVNARPVPQGEPATEGEG